MAFLLELSGDLRAYNMNRWKSFVAWIQRKEYAVAVKMHHVDFRWVLPLLASLPLPIGYRLARLRGWINAMTGRDWRSMALGFRHIYHQCFKAYQELSPLSTPAQWHAWRRQRFVAEAMDEYEGALLAKHRLHMLDCKFYPTNLENVCVDRERGLLMLTPHFQSFCLGMAFLAKEGVVANAMSSKVTEHTLVDTAVRDHFRRKYQGLQQYFHGGRVLNMEEGVRPFFDMMARGEVLMALADAPPLPNGVVANVQLFGSVRQIAGGNIRMAERYGCDIGGFICRNTGIGQYRLEVCEPGPATDPETINRIYAFFSQAISADPGGWWASDLLPAMHRAHATAAPARECVAS